MTQFQLVELAAQLGIESEYLDEAVHEAASDLASAINNGGINDQIEFLISRYEGGEKDVEELLQGMAE